MNNQTETKPPKGMISPELVAQAKAGDQAAFAELYELTSPELYRSVRSMVRDEDLAWDILQDSYVRAWRSMEKLTANEAFLPWLRRIAVNVTSSEMAKRRTLNFSELAVDEDERELEIPDLSVDNQPELALDRQETSRLVREILSELSEEQQIVVGMHYYEDMPINEIAKTLSIAPGTVKALLFRGRKRIEAGVRALEKQGVKLYGLTPLPFLIALLRRLEPTRQAERTALAAVLTEAPAAGAAVSAAAGTAVGASAGTVTAMTAGQAFLHGTAGKLVAGLLVLTLLGGGIWGGSKLLKASMHRVGDNQPTDSQLVTTLGPEQSSEERLAGEETAPTVPDSRTTTEPSVSTDPSDSSNPSDPSDPTESSGPTDPSNTPNPSESTDPSNPADPTDPSGSTEPSGNPEPSDSPAPSEGADPTKPSIPPGGQTDPSADPTTEHTEPTTEHTEPTTETTEPPPATTEPPPATTAPPPETTEPPPETTEPPVELITGVCGANGDNLTWSLNPSTGEMTIEGSGNMADYSSVTTVPWYSYHSIVKKVTVSAGAESIGAKAFYGCPSLSSVTLPTGLSSIGNYGFYYCSSLSALTLPEGLSKIGIDAFTNTKIASLNIPSSLTSIPSTTFYNCSTLASFTVASGNPNYCDNDGVLYSKDMKTLVQCPPAYSGVLNVPEGVTSVRGVMHCTKLTTVNFPASLEEIINLQSCPLISSVTVPKNVKKISTSFTSMESLQSIDVVSGNSSYSSTNGVLYNKSQTTLIRYPQARSGSFTVPESVTSLNDSAFSKCSKLTAVTLPSNLKNLGSYTFESCTGIASITIPDGVSQVAGSVFRNCSSLTAVTLSNNTYNIGSYAFSGTGITSITLPDKMQIIGPAAFSSCGKLSSITIPAGVTTISKDAFQDSSKVTIHGYAGSYAETYANQNNIPFEAITP